MNIKKQANNTSGSPIPGLLSSNNSHATSSYQQKGKNENDVTFPHHLVSPAQPKYAVTPSNRRRKKHNKKNITLQTNSMVSHPFSRKHPPRSVCHTRKGVKQSPPPLTVTARSPLSVGRVTWKGKKGGKKVSLGRMLGNKREKTAGQIAL